MQLSVLPKGYIVSVVLTSEIDTNGIPLHRNWQRSAWSNNIRRLSAFLPTKLMTPNGEADLLRRVIAFAYSYQWSANEPVDGEIN